MRCKICKKTYKQKEIEEILDNNEDDEVLLGNLCPECLFEEIERMI